jgi:hypothetical protein
MKAYGRQRALTIHDRMHGTKTELDLQPRHLLEAARGAMSRSSKVGTGNRNEIWQATAGLVAVMDCTAAR